MASAGVLDLVARIVLGFSVLASLVIAGRILYETFAYGMQKRFERQALRRRYVLNRRPPARASERVEAAPVAVAAAPAAAAPPRRTLVDHGHMVSVTVRLQSGAEDESTVFGVWLN